MFPTRFLPRIVRPETVVGKTRTEFGGIPIGADVFAGIGDLHSSLFPVQRKNEAGKKSKKARKLLFDFESYIRENY